MNAPLVVELCAGTGVLSAAFRRRGWRSFTVDTDARHRPDWCGDVRQLGAEVLGGEVPAFVWAAPPCVEFSRHDQPWTKARAPSPPDVSILDACARLVASWRPPWWALETVRGGGPWFRPRFGEPVAHVGRSFYLYGALPPLPRLRMERFKRSRSSGAQVARASYPAGMVDAVAESVDAAVRLLGRSAA